MGPRTQRARARRRTQGRIGRACARIAFPMVFFWLLALLWPGPAWMLRRALPQDSEVYARGEHLVWTFHGSVDRIPLPPTAIPPSVQQAVVAAEDPTFWIEPAANPVSIIRAAVANLRQGRIVQGGSTITQQLAKTLYLSQDRRWTRKLLELFLSVKLNATYSKREILCQYLNDVYFGHGTWGIEAASRRYFGHSARHLTLAEAAVLAGILNAPSADDPIRHPALARQRRQYVLQQMQRWHLVSARAAQAAQRVPLGAQRRPRVPSIAPYFVDAMVHSLQQIDPKVAHTLDTGGYRIDTTLDRATQQAADRAVRRYLPRIPGHPDVALVALDPLTGGVRALIGGRDDHASPFNRATQARRQVGSIMKYFLYTAVINAGYSPSAVRLSEPLRFPDGPGRWYVPHNPDHRYDGPLTIRQAIARSDNLVALEWMQTVGPATVIHLAQAMGITSPLNPDLTLALGSASLTPLEVARAVSPLANGGWRVTPHFIRQITTAAGRPVYRAARTRIRVLSPQVAFIVSSLFTAPLTDPHGTAHALAPVIARPAAVKTGTTSRQHDAWLVGYTPQLVAAVWVGYDRPRSLGLSASRAAGPIWAHFMARALDREPARAFSPPPGVVQRRVCADTGLLARRCCSSYPEWFITGHTPPKSPPGCSLPPSADRTRLTGPIR